MNIPITCSVDPIGSVLLGREDMLPEPASSYAISKPDCEHLARMFYTEHRLRTTCLCYFNIRALRHDLNSAYATAIPIFRSCAHAGEETVIYGDGTQTRDGVLLSDVVRANTGRIWS